MLSGWCVEMSLTLVTSLIQTGLIVIPSSQEMGTLFVYREAGELQ